MGPVLRASLTLTLCLTSWAGPDAPQPLLYRNTTPVPTTLERFTTPNLADAPILNPPGFRWDPLPGARRYTLQLSRTRDFAPRDTQTFRQLSLNLFTPAQALSVGRWFWRVKGEGETASSAWSDTREFHLAAGLPSIPVPPLDALRNRLRQNGHPRLFLYRDNLVGWRARVAGPRREEWAAFLAALDRDKLGETGDPPFPEGPRTQNTENNRAFLEATHRAQRLCEAVQSWALRALLTTDPEAGRTGRRLLLALAAWDPEGATSRKANDAAFRAVVRGLSRGYDWLMGAGALSDEDRALVRRVMIARAAQYAAWYRDAGVYERWPYPSHTFGGLPYFGELAVVFADELPEAPVWLQQWLFVMTANYPSFGRADGSWSEGGRYWHNTLARQLFAVWGIGPMLGVPLDKHPFFAQTGYFKTYSNPPWGKMSPFGDAHNQGAGRPDFEVMEHLAGLLGNADFGQYSAAGEAGSKATPNATTAEDFLLADRGQLAALSAGNQVPRLPLARAFPDTGLVTLRTDLTRKENDIQFLLKSNPFGPVSHAHADQGNFYLAAFGEPLLIPSGHYQGGHEVLFGSPHHAGWTWQSWANNVPLVDGKGQAVRTGSAAGQIEHFFHSRFADYARVEAGRAYQAPIGEEGRRTIQRFNPTLLQRIGDAPVRAYRRSVLFLRPGALVLFDDLEATRPVSFDWLLHAWNRFAIDTASHSVTTENGDARVLVRLLSAGDANIEQTNEFGVPVPARYPRQWHLTARFAPAARHRLVSVLLPHHANDRLPELKEATGEGWSGVHLRWPDSRESLVAFAASRDGQLTPSSLSLGGVEVVAEAAATSSGPARWTYAAGARRIAVRANAWGTAGEWVFPRPVDILLVKEGGSVTLQVSTTEAFEAQGRHWPVGTTSLRLEPQAARRD